MYFKLFFIFILLILPIQGARKKSRSIYFLATKDDVNPKYIRQFQVNISRRHDSLNILLEFTQEMKEVWATVGVDLWQKFNSQFRPIFSYDIDFCETLKRIKTSKIQIVNVWIGNFWKYGNMSTTCPFGTTVYFFRNFKFDKESIPSYLPSGRIQTYVSLYKKIGGGGSKDIINESYLTLELK